MAWKVAVANGVDNDRGIFGGYYLFPNTVGNVYFADSVNGSSSNPGTSGGAAMDTLADAIAKATTNNGDTVILVPGHAETFAGAAALTISKSGLRIVGMGNGHNRPYFTWATSTAAQMIVSGSNVSFENIVFDFTGIDAVVLALSVTGTDVSFTNCEFICNSGTAGTVLGLVFGAGADRWVVKNCRFTGPAANTGTTTTAQLKYTAGVDGLCQGCYFTGKMTQAILNTGTVLRGLINNNDFVIATGTAAISVAAASTPFISGNRMNVASGTAPVVAAAGFVAGNSYSAAAGVTAGSALTF